MVYQPYVALSLAVICTLTVLRLQSACLTDCKSSFPLFILIFLLYKPITYPKGAAKQSVPFYSKQSSSNKAGFLVVYGVLIRIMFRFTIPSQMQSILVLWYSKMHCKIKQPFILVLIKRGKFILKLIKSQIWQLLWKKFDEVFFQTLRVMFIYFSSQSIHMCNILNV